MKTTAHLRIAACLAVLGPALQGAPLQSGRPNSKLCARESISFLEQALALPFASTTLAGDPAHVRQSQEAEAARGALGPAGEVPSTVPADVRRVLYVEGGIAAHGRAFLAQLTQTFSGLRVIISLDPGYRVLRLSGTKPLRLLWTPQHDRFAPAHMGFVHAAPVHDFGLVLKTGHTAYQQIPAHRRHPLQLVFVPSLFDGVRDLRPIPDGPTAIVLRSPRPGAAAARSAALYRHVLKVLQEGDFLYVESSYLPLRLFPATILGLEEVPVPVPSSLSSQPESGPGLGLTLYRKTSSVPEETMNQAYERDSALCAAVERPTPDWNPARFIKTWEGALAGLTGAERIALLGRLDRLLEDSSLTPWAREDRREAVRDIFTEPNKPTVLRERVAKPLVGLLVKVRKLMRQRAEGVSPPELQAVFSRLAQMQFSLGAIQTRLIAADRLKGTGAEMVQWIHAQRKLLLHYAGLYRLLRRSILGDLEDPSRPLRERLPDGAA